MKYWLICYDISDDKNRYYIEKTLQSYGERIQYSVFECAITKDNINSVLKELGQWVEDEDSLACFPICNWCQDKREIQGAGHIPHIVGYEVI